MANPAAITLRALASATAGADSSAWVDIGAGRSAAKLLLRVTACSGNLAVTVETSSDQTEVRTVRAFGTVNAKALLRMSVDELDQYVRVSFSVGGSATFAVDGEAHQLYATVDDLEDKLSQTVLERLDQENDSLRARMLIKASAAVQSALSVQYTMPITTVPDEVAERTADLAAFKIMQRIGWVGGGVDDEIKLNNDEANAWLKAVRERKVLPFGVVPDPEPAVHTSDLTDTTSALSQTVMPSRWTDWGDFG